MMIVMSPYRAISRVDTISSYEDPYLRCGPDRTKCDAPQPLPPRSRREISRAHFRSAAFAMAGALVGLSVATFGWSEILRGSMFTSIIPSAKRSTAAYHRSLLLDSRSTVTEIALSREAVERARRNGEQHLAWHTVATPNGPAIEIDWRDRNSLLADAGILPGDKIFLVNDYAATDSRWYAEVFAGRGDSGGEVTLGLIRAGRSMKVIVTWPVTWPATWPATLPAR
jgi:hypothetical protein